MRRAASGEAAVRAAYEREQTDEFIEPVLVGEEAAIRPGDSVMAFNFRPDRMRELTLALADAAFAEVDRGGGRPVGALRDDDRVRGGVALPGGVPTAAAADDAAGGARRGGRPPAPRRRDGEVPARHVLLRRGRGEARTPASVASSSPSPRDVPTYDHKPQMSAREAAAAFSGAWREDRPRFGIINFANPDMVGHTGVIDAAVRAIETVDGCLGGGAAGGRRRERGRRCVITADHGNADHMLEPDGSPNTAHSLNPVPLRRDRRRGDRCAAAACWPTSRRRCSSCSGSSSRPR